MESPYNGYGDVNAHYQIKPPVPGMGYILLSCWPKSFPLNITGYC